MCQATEGILRTERGPGHRGSRLLEADNQSPGRMCRAAAAATGRLPPATAGPRGPLLQTGLRLRLRAGSASRAMLGAPLPLAATVVQTCERHTRHNHQDCAVLLHDGMMGLHTSLRCCDSGWHIHFTWDDLPQRLAHLCSAIRMCAGQQTYLRISCCARLSSPPSAGRESAAAALLARRAR